MATNKNTFTLPAIEQMAKQMEADILADVRNGTLPANVQSFSALHDYADANMYGKAGELLEEYTQALLQAGHADDDCTRTEALDVVLSIINPAQAIVEAWIVAGGIVKAIENDKQIKVGDTVRYVEVREDGDADARFTVLEVLGDRMRVRFIAPELQYPPIYIQPVSWFVVAK